ncbi:hypothetical protein GQ53DRAFT_762232 [Thozetella sp. PMI_491]|nr:hypothetical protein GQ53DRAFT_762232 [Thozetella sp. PMI_491]
MTKPGKCDCCRLRKVKCDEARPICGVCRKGGRVCTYTYGKATRFVEVQRDKRGKIRRTVAAPGPAQDDLSLTGSPESSEQADEPLVVLSLRSTREAKCGSGLFQTFVPLSSEKGRLRPRFGEGQESLSQVASSGHSPVPSPSPRMFQFDDGLDGYENDQWSQRSSDRSSASPPRSLQVSIPAALNSHCSNEKLLARWASLLGSGDPDDTSLCPMYIFGDWIGLVAPHIKESEAVRTATACLMDSAVAYVAKNEQNLNAARKSNATALHTIRMMIQAGDPFVPRNDVLIAIKLLAVVELFLGAYTQNYRYHAAGLVNLLQRMCQHGRQYDEISQQIFYASFIADATAAILGGRNSVFDDPAWLDIPPPQTSTKSCPRSDVAWQYIMRTFIRVPRLVRLVRKAREAPGDVAARERAQLLATELFESDLEEWVQEITNAGAIMTWPNVRPDIDPYGPECFNFASPRLFILLTTYWMTRIFICGCVQTLCDMAPLSNLDQMFNQEAARAEDVRAATNIAMCAQYALKTSPILPVVPLRLQMPTLISFGAWHRLETRELMLRITGNDTPASNAEGAHATSMKLWCVRLSCDISSKWNGVLTGVQDLEEKTESLSGGPLLYA